MINKIIVLSDIHANLTALRAVIDDFESKYVPDAIAILGDIVNYGMRPNEVISKLELLEKKYYFICNLRGNHEQAIMDGDVERFSTSRGAEMLRFTAENLSKESLCYISKKLLNPLFHDKENDIIFIHGSSKDPLWGKITFEEMNDSCYSAYNYVISGHTHIPHYYEVFYSNEDLKMRNKKKTIFLNPGSVGQSRNHNPFAHYVYIDISSQTIHMNAVNYDIENEKKLYKDEFFSFYRDRLELGV